MSLCKVTSPMARSLFTIRWGLGKRKFNSLTHQQVAHTTRARIRPDNALPDHSADKHPKVQKWNRSLKLDLTHLRNKGRIIAFPRVVKISGGNRVARCCVPSQQITSHGFRCERFEKVASSRISNRNAFYVCENVDATVFASRSTATATGEMHGSSLDSGATPCEPLSNADVPNPTMKLLEIAANDLQQSSVRKPVEIHELGFTQASLSETNGKFITPTESIKEKLRREGIEHQPGPMLVESVPPMTYEELPELTIIESINLTSLRTKSVQAKTRKAHIGMYQKAKVPRTEQAEVIKEFAEAKWKLLLGPLDPEKAIAAAGVAGASRNPKLIKDIEAMTAKFKTACESGRLGFYEVGIGKGEQVRIVNVYGWTGAHTDRHARKRTANLFNIMKAELEAQSEAATFIMGDFN